MVARQASGTEANSPVPTMANKAAPYAEPSWFAMSGDSLSEDVGEDLTPEWAAGAAFGSADGGYGNAQPFDDIEAVLLTVRNPFDDGANEIGAGMFRR